MRKVRIIAGNPSTNEVRTELQGSTPMWSIGDRLGFHTDNNTSGEMTNKGKAASEVTTFEGKIDAAAKILYVYYPARANAKPAEGANTIPMEIPTTQHPTAGSFDSRADVLIAKPITENVSGFDGQKAQFARVTGILRVILRVEGTELQELALENLTLSVDQSPEGGLTGIADLNITQSMGFTALSGNPTKEVTAQYSAENQFILNSTDGTILCVYPQTLPAGTQLTIAGNTAYKTFRKTITLQKPIEIVKGKFTTLGIKLDASHISDRKVGAALPFTDDFKWMPAVPVINSLPENCPYVSFSNIFNDKGTLKLGSKPGSGHLTTKDLNLAQPFTISVKAKKFRTNQSKLLIFVDDKQVKEFDLGRATDFESYTIDCDPATPCSHIRFEDRNTCYINHIEIKARK